MGSADADEVFHGELVEGFEGHGSFGGGVRVEVLVGGLVGEEGLEAVVGGGPGQLVQAEAVRASWTAGSARKAAARSLRMR